jgi:catechol 2,3-dioxygenase-like lactoylglutathione lyase family enzyme
MVSGAFPAEAFHMITQIGLHTVVVKDLNKALKFYRDKLGLRVVFFNKKLDWLTFDGGNCALSLTVPWNKASKQLVGVETGISFYVDDCEKTYKELKKKKVRFHLAPRKEKWGGILANFADPYGNKFFLLQMPSDFKR